MAYNTAAIRDLMKAVFDDEELTTFLYDHCRPVYDKLAPGMSRLWKIQLLIDYCERQELFEEVLNEVERINPKQCSKFIPLAKARPPTTVTDSSSSKSQIEITVRGELPVTSEILYAAIGALAGALDIPRDQIGILEVQGGSMILQIEMSTEAVHRLITLYEAVDPVIQDLGIQKAEVIHKQPLQIATPLSDLRRILTKYFSDSELINLCFDLNVDYEDLPAVGKANKARELIVLMGHHGRLPELEAAVRRERPKLDAPYSQERTQELHEMILNTVEPAVRDAYVELTQQIDAYLEEFNSLHKQLEEWKDVHSKLQEIQQEFAHCHSYKYALDKLKSSDRSVQRDKERLLFEIEVEWRPCMRRLRELKVLAENVLIIGEPYREETDAGPDWFLQPWRRATELDEAVRGNNILALADRLSAFDTVIGDSLFRVDKFLLGVANQINRLPRPS